MVWREGGREGGEGGGGSGKREREGGRWVEEGGERGKGGRWGRGTNRNGTIPISITLVLQAVVS